MISGNAAGLRESGTREFKVSEAFAAFKEPYSIEVRGKDIGFQLDLNSSTPFAARLGEANHSDRDCQHLGGEVTTATNAAFKGNPNQGRRRRKTVSGDPREVFTGG